MAGSSHFERDVTDKQLKTVTGSATPNATEQEASSSDEELTDTKASNKIQISRGDKNLSGKIA